ncbi:BaiN/RdsA family NAD(P)/FAD-dependent oxidoreductase [Undibacterium griseum]|uniref:TIGR03862 family flavoprotein n=1 Tax=Undibacterium griseum TaxID=2762295 RepID=A0ABR6YPP4_9BURK|nr:TIGR03862 family flavoprotein [Undibacterium griseum]MBC3885845.1 TIGR03862 family flavoprotein [Undibacterium griseum]
MPILSVPAGHHASAPSAVRVMIIGGGPAGLMAAEVLSAAGLSVDLYDAMASVGRKFLLAGKGGMNLTHSEPFPAFMARYGERAEQLRGMIEAFDADALRAWAQGLGVATFVGSSGRVFPTDMKAAPLLRAWLHRLRTQGVRFHMRHRWQGWDPTGEFFRFTTPEGEQLLQADAVVLALGGGSWARLGSDGAWVPWLRQRGVAVAQLQPANCGFERPWSDFFRHRFAGHPVLTVAARVQGGAAPMRQGQFVITESGVEGSLIYALSSALREQIHTSGQTVLELDLLPDRSPDWVAQALASGRGSRSWTSFLQSRLGLDPLKAALLHEVLGKFQQQSPATDVLARHIKHLPLSLQATRPIDEAISSAGGVQFSAMQSDGMLQACPGVFCAGEMLDWEAPTGGYLLTACFASGRMVAGSVIAYLQNRQSGAV